MRQNSWSGEGWDSWRRTTRTPRFPGSDRPAAFIYLDCEVETTAGEKIGRVQDVMTLPANWVLQVVDDDGRELLIPVIDEVIREVDRSSGRVVIEAIAGLLDPDGD